MKNIKILSAGILLTAGLSLFAPIAFAGERIFEVEVKPMATSERVQIQIDNPEHRQLTVTLYDAAGTPLYKFGVSKKQSGFQQDFNFTGAEEGIYKLSVSDGKHQVNKEIVLSRSTETVVTHFAVK